MAKRKSTLGNMLLALFVITLVSGGVLGAVCWKTYKRIEDNNDTKTTQAVKEVLPEFDHLKEYKIAAEDLKGKELIFREAYDKNDNLIGTAIETLTDKGFGGEVRLMVGLLPDLTINKISVLAQSETPGLGAKMGDEFKDQFAGKKVESELKVVKDGGDVDAITAATISSRAFCDAVNRAVRIYKEQKGL